MTGSRNRAVDVALSRLVVHPGDNPAWAADSTSPWTPVPQARCRFQDVSGIAWYETARQSRAWRPTSGDRESGFELA